jgi:hypothetical protein
MGSELAAGSELVAVPPFLPHCFPTRGFLATAGTIQEDLSHVRSTKLIRFPRRHLGNPDRQIPRRNLGILSPKFATRHLANPRDRFGRYRLPFSLSPGRITSAFYPSKTRTLASSTRPKPSAAAGQSSIQIMQCEYCLIHQSLRVARAQAKFDYHSYLAVGPQNLGRLRRSRGYARERVPDKDEVPEF